MAPIQATVPAGVANASIEYLKDGVVKEVKGDLKDADLKKLAKDAKLKEVKELKPKADWKPAGPGTVKLEPGNVVVFHDKKDVTATVPAGVANASIDYLKDGVVKEVKGDLKSAELKAIKKDIKVLKVEELHAKADFKPTGPGTVKLAPTDVVVFEPAAAPANPPPANSAPANSAPANPPPSGAGGNQNQTPPAEIGGLSTDQREFLADTCEQAERYDLMLEYLLPLAEACELSKDQREQLAVAFKRVVGGLRGSLKVVCAIVDAQGAERKAVVKKLQDDLHKDLATQCEKACTVFGQQREKAAGQEAKVHNAILVGDYSRYMWEYADGDAATSALEKATKAYEGAVALTNDAPSDGEPAKEGFRGPAALHVTHPLRLQLALNYSVFLHDTNEEEPEEAIKLARAAFDDALAELDGATDDAQRVLQLLQANLNMWEKTK